MGADREEGGVEFSGLHAFDDTIDLGVELDDNPEVSNSVNFRIKHVARQAVFWYPEAHHAAGKWAGLVDFDRMPHPPQVISGGQARRTGADHKHALAAVGLRRRELPAFANRNVAEETLD